MIYTINVFKNVFSKKCIQESIQEWTKNSRMNCLSPFKFFKGCVRQILLGSFLNTLSQMTYNGTFATGENGLFFVMYSSLPFASRSLVSIDFSGNFYMLFPPLGNIILGNTNITFQEYLMSILKIGFWQLFC